MSCVHAFPSVSPSPAPCIPRCTHVSAQYYVFSHEKSQPWGRYERWWKFGSFQKLTSVYITKKPWNPKISRLSLVRVTGLELAGPRSAVFFVTLGKLFWCLFIIICSFSYTVLCFAMLLVPYALREKIRETNPYKEALPSNSEISRWESPPSEFLDIYSSF